MKPLYLLPLLCVALLLGLGWSVQRFVDLTPVVDERFFFAADSPEFVQARALERQFSGRQLLGVAASAPTIDSPVYRKRVETLTERLNQVPGVYGVRSLANGPRNLEDARASPLWSRLLLGGDGRTSNLLVVVDDRKAHTLVEGIDRVLAQSQRPDFRLQLAGVPYVVDSIAGNLQHDFRVFSLGAIGVFALVIFGLFRSLAITIGSLVACGCAALATLLSQHLMGEPIGLLTANLVTIVFVLTQSHVAFLTCNWRHLRPRARDEWDGVRLGVLHTLTASGWCMVTAFLGFASLLYVEAQPLRALGHGGIVGTVCALAAAYLVYPPFLLWAGRPSTAAAAPLALRLPSPALALGLLAGVLAVGAGAKLVNTDPTLFDYFAEGSPVWNSLDAVDAHGGSSTLNIAVRRSDGKPLDNAESYKRMWALQRELQEDPAVGTVISLPVLMAEAKRSPLSWFLTWHRMMDVLSMKHFDRVARGFISEDRKQGLFMFRMIERGRVQHRTVVVQRLESIVRKHSFKPTMVGGIYGLQGRLADLVTRSLFEGLAGLLAACALIALIVTRSLRGGFALAACAATVPAATLGLFGFLSLPLDIVATPAVNVALGVAVDSMIHLGTAWRRTRQRYDAAQAAKIAQEDQAAGILTATVVVLAGFSIFALSSFPPTQRFGLAVVIGAAVAGMVALSIFPALLAGRRAPARPATTSAADAPAPALPG